MSKEKTDLLLLKTLNKGNSPTDDAPNKSLDGVKLWFARYNELIDGGHLATLSGFQWKVLSVYHRHAANSSGRAFPGAKTIAVRVGSDIRHVRRAIRELESMGFIDTIEVGGKGEQDCAVRRVKVPSRAKSALQEGGEIGPTRVGEGGENRPGEWGENVPSSRAKSALRTTHGTTNETAHLTTAKKSGESRMTQKQIAQVIVEKPIASIHPGFSAFYYAYPRKVHRAKSLEIWIERDFERFAAPMLVSLEKFKASEDWTKDQGKWIPSPANFLDDESFRTPPATQQDWREQMPEGRALTAEDLKLIHGDDDGPARPSAPPPPTEIYLDTADDGIPY
jgi:hypothetical protein